MWSSALWFYLCVCPTAILPPIRTRVDAQRGRERAGSALLGEWWLFHWDFPFPLFPLWLNNEKPKESRSTKYLVDAGGCWHSVFPNGQEGSALEEGCGVCPQKKRRRKERYWKAVSEEKLRGLGFVKSGSQGLWWS